jgi:NAD(P)-dependent dehydrogenase (short-subunit alcohol dehydrogenase family)
MGDLSGKAAFVTGAAGSIGRAVAARFADAGAEVFMIDVLEGVHAEAERIAKAGGRVTARTLDLRSGEDIARAVDAALSAYGRIDVLANVAAIYPPGRVLEQEEDVFRSVYEVNFFGPYRLCRAVAPQMVARKSGSIINFVSGVAFRPFATLAAYSSSKAALASLTKVLAAELAPDIRVNALSPGITARPPPGVEPGSPEEMASRPVKLNIDAVPMKRVGLPAEIAEAALFLASDRASFMTGETMMVDGGANMR